MCLDRHRHAQHPVNGRRLDLERRFDGTRDGLDLGFQLVVVRYADNLALVRDAEQDDAAGGVGKGAEFPSEVRRHGPFEFGRETLALGNHGVKGLLIHV